MKVFDTVNNVELEADTKKLVDIMVDGCIPERKKV